MKNILYFLVVCIGAYWLYNRCSDADEADKANYIKQVSVTVDNANLRVGPGTAYDYATRKADGSGGRWQVGRGIILNVVSAKQGWYEVHVGKDKRSVYIKQSLCSDIGGKGKAKSGATSNTSAKKGGKRTSWATPKDGSAPAQQRQTDKTATDPDVVEEVVGEVDDEVIF